MVSPSSVFNTWNKALGNGTLKKILSRWEQELTDSRNTGELLGGQCLFIHLVMGRAETFPRPSRSSTATLDSLGEIKPHIVAFPFKLKSPQIFHGKNLEWLQTRKNTSSLILKVETLLSLWFLLLPWLLVWKQTEHSLRISYQKKQTFYHMCRETGCPVNPLRNKAIIFVVSTGNFQGTSSFQCNRQVDMQSHNKFFVFLADCISSIRYKWNKSNFLQN